MKWWDIGCPQWWVQCHDLYSYTRVHTILDLNLTHDHRQRIFSFLISSTQYSETSIDTTCKSLWKRWLAELSRWMWKHPTPWRMWNRRFKTRKEFLPINNVWSLQGSNCWTVELWATTTSRRSLPFIWCCDCEEDYCDILLIISSIKHFVSSVIISYCYFFL